MAIAVASMALYPPPIRADELSCGTVLEGEFTDDIFTELLRIPSLNEVDPRWSIPISSFRPDHLKEVILARLHEKSLTAEAHLKQIRSRDPSEIDYYLRVLNQRAVQGGLKNFSLSEGFTPLLKGIQTRMVALLSQRAEVKGPLHIRIIGLGSAAGELFELATLLDQALDGESGVKRDGESKLDAVKRLDIRFNLYDKRLESIRAGDHAAAMTVQTYPYLESRISVGLTDFTLSSLSQIWPKESTGILIARNSIRNKMFPLDSDDEMFPEIQDFFWNALDSLTDQGIFMVDNEAARSLMLYHQMRAVKERLFFDTAFESTGAILQTQMFVRVSNHREHPGLTSPVFYDWTKSGL